MKPALSPALQQLAISVQTVERLAILLHVRALKDRRVTAQVIGTAFRVSAAAAEQHLAKLCAAGYLAVEIGTALHYSYRPMSPSLREAVDEAELRRGDLLPLLK